MAYQKIFVPKENLRPIFLCQETGILVPKDYFLPDTACVEVAEISSSRPFKLKSRFENPLSDKVAYACGFNTAEEALAFVRRSYEKEHLPADDIRMYSIVTPGPLELFPQLAENDFPSKED